jgi:hypothetical protein
MWLGLSCGVGRVDGGGVVRGAVEEAPLTSFRRWPMCGLAIWHLKSHMFMSRNVA